VGILAVAFIHQSQTGVLTFELPALMRTHLSGHRGRAPLPGLHRRLRGQGADLPVPHLVARRLRRSADRGLAVLLAAVMAKLGTYGIVRFDLNLFPQATRTLAPWLLTLAVIGILYGALVACAQRDLKRLLAYSSLAQIGFIVLGTFALNSQGLTGGVLQMVNHGLIIATLFIWWDGSTSGAAPGRSPRCKGLQYVGAGDGRRLHRGHAGLHRRARAQRLRQ
jgi:NADH-quinone oxidoreductase subunit M